MTSRHTRNVSGMHEAPRCDATTRNGDPCRAPAANGGVRCHVHSGKPARRKSYQDRFGDYNKATIERDRRMTIAIKLIDALLRKIERGGDISIVAGGLIEIRQVLVQTTRTKHEAFAAAYRPSAAERRLSKAEAERAAFSARYNPEFRRSRAGERDRAIGAMLGLAVGEAIGVTLDGQPRDGFRPISGMIGGGRLGLDRGEWASATAMSLALAESLAFRKRFEPVDFAGRLDDWERTGAYSCSGTAVAIDPTAKAAIERYREMNDPLAGDDNPDTADVSSLVRVAPVAVRYWSRIPELLATSADQSRLTHAAPDTLDACKAWALLLSKAIEGRGKAGIVTDHLAGLLTPVDCLARGSWRSKTRSQLRIGEKANTAVENAMWCLHHSQSFEEAVLLAANLGGPSANLGALTGQMAGALYGKTAIPFEWRSELAWCDKIVKQAEQLFDQSLS